MVRCVTSLTHPTRSGDRTFHGSIPTYQRAIALWQVFDVAEASGVILLFDEESRHIWQAQ
ncbi:hypothetical protein [Nostoc sp.]|uniref:hypothetical protein n=1 Tax=Nostoc sp. TaxID=1180 RepID=UPI003FA593B8